MQILGIAGIIFIILITGFIMFSFHTYEHTRPVKVNKHGLYYNTTQWSGENFHLGFWDEESKTIIWLLTKSISVDSYDDIMREYAPALSKNWYSVYRLEDMIDYYKTIEQVKKENEQVKINVDESIADYQDRKKRKYNEIYNLFNFNRNYNIFIEGYF